MSSSPDPAGSRPSAVASAGLILGGLLFLGSFHWLYRFRELEASFIDLRLLPTPSPGEVWVLLLLLLIVVPAGVLIGEGLRRLLPGLPRRLLTLGEENPRQVALLLALLASLSALLVRHLVALDADFTDDERTYWYQAQVLLEGAFVGPVPLPTSAFLPAFAVVTGTGTGFAGIFPLGQPLLLAAGSLLGDPSLFQALACGGIVFLTWRLAGQVLATPRLPLLAAAIVALSPWLLGVAATRHNVVPSTFFSLLALFAALETRARPSLWRALLAGFAIGATFLLRPLDGLAVGLTVAAVWIAAFRSAEAGRRPGIALRTGAALATTLAVASVQLVSNLRVNGGLLETAYPRWLATLQPGAPLFGFGSTIWGVEQTPLSALTKALTALGRIELWATGWPLFLLLVAIGLSRRSLWRRGWPLALFVALIFGGYFLYMFPSVNDFGTLYHLPTWPALAIAAAAGGARLAERFGPERVAAHALAAMIAAMATFWVVQADRVHGLAADINRPIELAEEVAEAAPGGKILVLWSSIRGGRPSWVLRPPLPSPTLDEPVLWVRDRGELHAELSVRYADRAPFRLVWPERGEPTLVPADLGRQRSGPF